MLRPMMRVNIVSIGRRFGFVREFVCVDKKESWTDSSGENTSSPLSPFHSELIPLETPVVLAANTLRVCAPSPPFA